jgi:Ferritin-like domain/Sec-independent protein translocase protein (TatC)
MTDEAEAAERRPDGAMRELAEDAGSRKRFLRMMGRAGAAGAFAIFMAACGGDDDSASSGSGAGTTKTNSGGAMTGDLAIVQYALTLEHLETDFYNAVIDAGVIKDKALAETAKMIRDNEQDHVDTLTGAVKDLGGTPKRPKTIGVLVITRLGVVSVETLRRNRRYAILGIAVIAALLPTLDPVTLVLEMAPLVALYELGILLARAFPAIAAGPSHSADALS